MPDESPPGRKTPKLPCHGQGYLTCPNKPRAPHKCPHKQELGSDPDELCNCCDDCTGGCCDAV